MEHEIVIVGVNHRTASVEVRESVAFAEEGLDEVHQRLCSLDDVAEAAVISTCNRVEVVATSRRGVDLREILARFLRNGADSPSDLQSNLYSYCGRDAVRHLFRVSSSLDSMVIGEPQILGQLKEFYARAARVGATGAVLHRFFHKAFSVAKRVRSETEIAGRAVSVSSAAVELAAKIFDSLADKTAMLIGAGKMGELAARHLVASGVNGIIVCNRTFDKAVELARQFNGTSVPFERLPQYLQLADIVIGSTASTGFVLTEPMVQEALRQRKGRPIFCIDMSVPRNFDPRINELDNVYLYDIDDLGRVTQDNLGERVREAEKAERIVDQEVESFWHWLEHLEVVPTIVALRDKVEGIRRAELQKTLQVLRDLSPREREALDSMTAAIVNKILHTPIMRLKEHDQRQEAYYIDATRRLFGLEGPDES